MSQATRTLDRREQHAAATRLTEIGPYRLRALLGEGGMGAVWLAEQTTPVQRLVAVKVTRIDLSSAGRLARFEAERQILATLRHPHIAQVLDAGDTAEGFPYLVMEYVPGQTLDDYCDNHRLDLRTRIGLLVQACAALTHAHQRGVIHRDIKPANLLVEARDRHHHLKLIDFGIARLIARSDRHFTDTGHSPGTPQYMSPEQHAGSTDIDTRSDVYALGLTGCQLLAGGLPEMPTGDPVQPSQVLVRQNDPATTAAQRRCTSAELLRQLRGDLDRIIAKATQPVRELRYGSVGEFSEDLERHLAGLPVRATAPTFGYLLRKWIGRHRIESALAASLLLVVVLGAFVLLTAWRQERNARAAADAQLRLHHALNAYVIAVLERTHAAYAGADLRLSDLVRLARIEADRRFAHDLASRAAAELLLRQAEAITNPAR